MTHIHRLMPTYARPKTTRQLGAEQPAGRQETVPFVFQGPKAPAMQKFADTAISMFLLSARLMPEEAVENAEAPLFGRAAHPRVSACGSQVAAAGSQRDCRRNGK